MNNNNYFWKSAMNYGAMLGLALIIYSLIQYLFGLYTSSTVGMLSYVVLIAGIFFAIKTYRDKQNGGMLTYKKGLGMGTMVALFAGVLLGFFIFIELKFIDPNLMESVYRFQEEKMLEKGLSDSQIEMSMNMVRKFSTPLSSSFFVVLGYTIIGFIISLGASAILKKEDNGFDTAMQNIQ